MKLLAGINKFHRSLFIVGIGLLAILAYVGSLSIVTIGGMYLMLAALWMANGKIFYASIIYVLADLCWAINAWHLEDYFGFTSVIFGLSMGLLVMYKMKEGIFVMDLHAKS